MNPAFATRTVARVTGRRTMALTKNFITEDGRVSYKKYVLSQGAEANIGGQSFRQRYVPNEVLPIFAVIGAAVGLCAYSSARFMFQSPDVRFDRSGRSTEVVRSNEEEGERWASHRKSFAGGKKPNEFSLNPTLDRLFASRA